jgi:glycosyltransferase involved in cell wall biosynthesis
MNPTVDLLIPVYNGRPFLDSLISGVEKTKKYFSRVIFYDDASKDGSAEYLIQKGYEVIQGAENRGQAYARNELLKAATSDFVHFHDMDDPLFETFFEQIIPTLDRSRISIGSFATEHAAFTSEYRSAPSLSKGILSLQDAYKYFIHLSSVIIPRKVINGVGGFNQDLRLHEDRFLFLLLAKNGMTWNVCANARAIQYCHGKNTTATVGWTFHRINWIRYFELAFGLFPVENLNFMYSDLLKNSQELLKDGEYMMARRGFALCEKIGVEQFFDGGSKFLYLAKKIGLYNTFCLKRLLNARIKLVW